MNKLTQISLNAWLGSLLFILVFVGFMILLFNLPIELYLQTTLQYHDQNQSFFSLSSSDALKVKVGNQVYLHLGTNNYLIKIQELSFDQDNNQFNIFFNSLNASWDEHLANNMTLEATIIYDLIKVQDLFF